MSLRVSRTSPVFDNPDNLRIAGQVFGRSLRCDVSAVFSHDRLGGTGFVEEQCRGTGPLAARPIKSTYFQHDLSLLMVTSIAWPRERLSGVSTAKLLFLPLFYTAFLRKEVTMYSPQLRSEALRPASLRAECLHYLESFCIDPFSPICLVTDLCQYRLMSIYFTLRARMQYYFILLFQLVQLGALGAFSVAPLSF